MVHLVRINGNKPLIGVLHKLILIGRADHSAGMNDSLSIFKDENDVSNSGTGEFFCPCKGEINREDYDKWRYHAPKYDETSGYGKIPSLQLSDAMVKAFKERLKAD